MKQSVARVWEEITLQQEETPIDLKLTPEEEKKQGLISKILSGPPKELKVAFVHDKSPLTSGWTYGHELGRLHVQRVFKQQIVTTAYEQAMEGDPLKVIEQAIADGNKTIFTTSPQLLPASLRAAVDHPEVTILNCSLNKSHRYIRTYYARMYEAKFIIGALAATLAKDDRVGYICDYPIYGQIAGINAFALGLQMVNPRARVFLEWSSIGGTDAANQRLTDRGIDLISAQDSARMDEGVQNSFGLYQLTQGKKTILAMPVWQWGVYYETIIRSILDHSFQSQYEESNKALNYYWGMSSGVVEIICSSKLPESTVKLVELLRKSICSGICNPFQGPLHLQDGSTIESKGREISLEQIINMDWLVSNVEGEIPTYDQLNDVGKATVNIVGVEKAAEDKRS
jgi:basic membrane lipoprotein Med (substrate-binding protein (PBP1-ABC) superfamily)